MQRLEDTDLFTFKSRVMRLDLGGIKSLYREIYDAKAARGRTWNMETIIKVEKMETFVRKALSGKGLLNRLLSAREVDRVGPATVEGLSAAARRRWAEDPSYRPVPLRRLGL
jgi:hypothetical protein